MPIILPRLDGDDEATMVFTTDGTIRPTANPETMRVTRHTGTVSATNAGRIRENARIRNDATMSFFDPSISFNLLWKIENSALPNPWNPRYSPIMVADTPSMFSM